jgi:hypothetical protein
MSNENERIIWKLLTESKKALSVNEIGRISKVSKQSTRNILKRFKENGLIYYPEPQRGKKSFVMILSINMENFTKVKKQRKWIEESIGKPIIIKSRTGNINAGYIHSFENGSIWWNNSHRLKSDGKWFSGFILDNPRMGIDIKNIQFIYEPNYEKFGTNNLSLEYVMGLWTAPVLAMPKTIHCDYYKTRKHSKNCNHFLHEMILHFFEVSKLLKSKYQKKNFLKNIERLNYYFIQQGNQIPVFVFEEMKYTKRDGEI